MVTRPLLNTLARWLADGPRQIGQILISSAGEGFELRHIDDLGRDDLTLSDDPLAARHLANLDDAQAYRPLKTAPNLQHGWRLLVRDLPDLRLALDYFYPAMLGVLFSQQHGDLHPVDLRSTLNRQTGMYRITQKITDAQADELVGETCRSNGGCLKTILWHLAEGVPVSTLPPEKFQPGNFPEPGAPFPLLCHEACNLLVAAARTVVKKQPPSAE